MTEVSAAKPVVTVVVPVFNGAVTLEETCTRLDAVLTMFGRPFELILVDDGSEDSTWDLIASRSACEGPVRGLRLAQNVGQAGALTAGFAAAKGQIVCMIDVDLETDPEDLPKLIEAVEGGADLASGRRVGRRRWLRQLPSWAFNARARRLGIPLHDIGCGMNAMTAQVAREYVAGGAPRRSLPKPTLIALSRTIVEIPVRSHRPEHSHLAVGDLLMLWLEFEVAFRRPPWLALVWLGVAGLLVGVAEVVVGVLALMRSDGGWLVAAGVPTILVAGLVIAAGMVGGWALRVLALTNRPHFRVIEAVGDERSEGESLPDR